MENLDNILMRLGEAPLHPRLAMMDEAVFAALADPLSCTPHRGFESAFRASTNIGRTSSSGVVNVSANRWVCNGGASIPCGRHVRGKA